MIGLGAALEWFTRTLHERTTLAVKLEAEGLVDRGMKGALDPELETLAFRIVQEALNNVVKHGGEDVQAEVEVVLREDLLTLEIRDSGVGFKVAEVMTIGETPVGYGLRGMRDRAELFSGRLWIDSTPGAGTQVRAEIPIPETGGGS